MPVNNERKEYIDACKRWDLVQAIVKNEAKHLIREVDPNDKQRSDQYRKDAILTNYTRLTQEGLTGLVFRKPMKVELPRELEYLEYDAIGMNINLEQLAQKEVMEVLSTGRFGLLADLEQQEGSAARIRAYCAGSIINWGYKTYGDRYKLNLVVLKEDVCYLLDDGFTWQDRVQYRVLKLNDEGFYYQEIWNESLEFEYGISIVDYNEELLDEIPFVFIGSENNDGEIDSIPLYDLAIVNLGAYRNSADVEEASFVCGQIVPHINVGESADANTFHEANPGGIVIGSRKGIVTAGGDFKFVQAQPNILPQQLIKDKEEQMVSIGARIIAPPGAGRETAEGARIRFGSQNSRLYVITKNINLAMEQVLWWIAKFMMETPQESTFKLNDQFYEETADPNMIQAQIMLLDRQAMNKEEIRDNLKRSGVELQEEFKPDPVDPMLGVDNDNELTRRPDQTQNIY